MRRKVFLRKLIGASTIITMDGLSTIANAISRTHNKIIDSNEFASFGAIHLNNTSLEKATHFWTQIVGMKLRTTSNTKAEFGTATQTLVVVHPSAKNPYQKGYSGLYHFAIHAPNMAAFASMINRLNVNKYPYAPVDHTMSKSVYLDDPDGINIEFTLETPERFKRIITQGGMRIEGTDGIIRSASARLDVNEVLKELKDTDSTEPIAIDTYIGHIHLYANHIENSTAFYKKLGYLQFNYLPEFMYSDLGAGGDYQHRVVMNTWHGTNKPLAPKESAGLRYYQINYNSKDQLDEALSNFEDIPEKEGSYWITDPTGNRIVLSHK